MYNNLLSYKKHIGIATFPQGLWILVRHALHLLRGHHQAVLVRVLGEEEQGLGVFRRDDGKIMGKSWENHD